MLIFLGTCIAWEQRSPPKAICPPTSVSDMLVVSGGLARSGECSSAPYRAQGPQFPRCPRLHCARPRELSRAVCLSLPVAWPCQPGTTSDPALEASRAMQATGHHPAWSTRAKGGHFHCLIYKRVSFTWDSHPGQTCVLSPASQVPWLFRSPDGTVCAKPRGGRWVVQLQPATRDSGGGSWSVTLGPGSASDRILGELGGDSGLQFCKCHGLHLENQGQRDPQ